MPSTFFLGELGYVHVYYLGDHRIGVGRFVDHLISMAGRSPGSIIRRFSDESDLCK